MCTIFKTFYNIGLTAIKKDMFYSHFNNICYSTPNLYTLRNNEMAYCSTSSQSDGKYITKIRVTEQNTDMNSKIP